MINNILLRAYSNRGLDNMDKVKSLILQHTDGITISEIDHSKVNLCNFDILPDETPISIDKFLSERLSIPYLRISRVFDSSGNVLHRYIDGNIKKTNDPIKVLDTDMVRGETIDLACSILDTTRYDVLLRVNEGTQDLIDIEDLMLSLSLMELNGNQISCSYLVNEKFFSKRTSLPISLYEPLRKLFYV